MISGIISAIIVGLIIPIWLTIVIGIVAALIGSAIAGALGVKETNGIDWIRWIIEIGLAAVGVYLVAGQYSRRGGVLR
jgi:hypothetical protein